MNTSMKKQIVEYLVGFSLCILLTGAAFTIGMLYEGVGLDGATVAVVILTGLALLQFVVQSVYFLHLDYEIGPRWRLASFFSMISVLLIIVVGSLWIMYNLNYNMMPGTLDEEQIEMIENPDEFIIKDEGIEL